MANVVIKRQYAAYNVDAYNRTAVCTGADLDNGSVFVLNKRSEVEGEGEVWVAENASATSKVLWMATSPEVVITKGVDGNMYKGLTPDPRAFVNNKGMMIDAIKLCEGDIIEMTGEGIEGDAELSAKEVYLVPQVGMKLKRTSTASNCIALHKIGTSHLAIGQGGIAKTPVPTYIFEVVIK